MMFDPPDHKDVDSGIGATNHDVVGVYGIRTRPLSRFQFVRLSFHVWFESSLTSGTRTRGASCTVCLRIDRFRVEGRHARNVNIVEASFSVRAVVVGRGKSNFDVLPSRTCSHNTIIN